ncbi:hypothetical protein [Paenibacillus antarcticus]|uniref:Uncharacterized protein n=1 Tax=Paenibacillus antarcticus TaxID=253703 RepID=A0A168PA32_9BACL|nr:hypothetical protein [Paenibacillus antarcticus]OAB46552.1 hypothetical protein PBAT_11080 [Paenibacillus antarcticus]
MSDDRFKDLQDLKESIEIGLEIEFYLYGDHYYIGAPQGELLIALGPDDEGDVYIDADDMLTNHKINGIPLKDIWQDIKIDRM